MNSFRGDKLLDGTLELLFVFSAVHLGVVLHRTPLGCPDLVHEELFGHVGVEAEVAGRREEIKHYGVDRWKSNEQHQEHNVSFLHCHLTVEGTVESTFI